MNRDVRYQTTLSFLCIMYLIFYSRDRGNSDCLIEFVSFFFSSFSCIFILHCLLCIRMNRVGKKERENDGWINSMKFAFYLKQNRSEICCSSRWKFIRNNSTNRKTLFSYLSLRSTKLMIFKRVKICLIVAFLLVEFNYCVFASDALNLFLEERERGR